MASFFFSNDTLHTLGFIPNGKLDDFKLYWSTLSRTQRRIVVSHMNWRFIKLNLQSRKFNDAILESEQIIYDELMSAFEV